MLINGACQTEPRHAVAPAALNVLDLIRLLWERKVAIAALGGAERKLVGVVLSNSTPRLPIITETDNMRERRAERRPRAA